MAYCIGARVKDFKIKEGKFRWDIRRFLWGGWWVAGTENPEGYPIPGNIQGCSKCPGLAEAGLVYCRKGWKGWPLKIPANPNFSMIQCFYNRQSEKTQPFIWVKKVKAFHRWKVTCWQSEMWLTYGHSSPVFYQIFWLSSSVQCSDVLIEIFIYWNFRDCSQTPEKRR